MVRKLNADAIAHKLRVDRICQQIELPDIVSSTSREYLDPDIRRRIIARENYSEVTPSQLTSALIASALMKLLRSHGFAPFVADRKFPLQIWVTIRTSQNAESSVWIREKQRHGHLGEPPNSVRTFEPTGVVQIGIGTVLATTEKPERIPSALQRIVASWIVERELRNSIQLEKQHLADLEAVTREKERTALAKKAVEDKLVRDFLELSSRLHAAQALDNLDQLFRTTVEPKSLNWLRERLGSAREYSESLAALLRQIADIAKPEL